MNAENRLAIASAGGIAPHSAALSFPSPLSAPPSVPLLRVATSEAGGIVPLVALSSSGTDEQRKNAAAALRNLAVNAENRVAIARAGGIAPPSAALSIPAQLTAPSSAPLHRVVTSEAGGVMPLVALASNGTAEQKKIAAAALANLAVNTDNKVAIARAGGMAPPSAALSFPAPLAAPPSAPLHRVATC